MEIIVDYNNDKVLIKPDDGPMIKFDIKRFTVVNMEKFLVELLNQIDWNEDSRGVRLVRINEDISQTIDEW